MPVDMTSKYILDIVSKLEAGEAGNKLNLNMLHDLFNHSR